MRNCVEKQSVGQVLNSQWDRYLGTTAAMTQNLSPWLNVVVDYTYALDTLDNYDYERLTIDKTTKQEPFHATLLYSYRNKKNKKRK